MGVGSDPSGTPAVSVVITTYNRARFLPETIDSVRQQRFRDFEIIVVDDGSTDNTRQVLRSYGDRVRAFYQENRGSSAARNIGICRARGKWIAIQDSDDLCTPDHLEILFDFVSQNPNYGMVFANGAYLERPEHNRDTIIPKEKSRRLAQQGVRLVDLLEKSIFRLQASLISKECFQAIGGFDEDLRICMDLDLAFRLFMRYPVAYFDKVVFLYRKHEGNISRDQELRLLENIRTIEKLVQEFPQAKEILGHERIARRVAYRYYRLAKGRWKRGNKDAAKEAIKQAIALCPLSLKYRLYQLRWV
jgi:glycosyltransferase involved in cell wall biosynthesis